MEILPINILKRIAKYEDIEYGGLTLCPVRVDDYDDFLISKPALEVMHQSLGIKYMRMPLLSALYAIDFEAALSGRTATGLFSKALLGLALSLRLGEGKNPEELLKTFQIDVDRNKPDKLLKLRFTDNDGTEKEITPAQYQTIRKIIARQNGVSLEDETANPAIVKSRRDMQSAGATQLDAAPDKLISIVAALSGTDEIEIYDWPIMKLEKYAANYERILSYIVCGVGEMSGATWKGGNPVPHPFYPRADGSAGFASAFEGEAEGKEKAQRLQAEAQNIEAQIKNHSL